MKEPVIIFISSVKCLKEFFMDSNRTLLLAQSPYAPWKAPDIASKFYHLSKEIKVYL